MRGVGKKSCVGKWQKKKSPTKRKVRKKFMERGLIKGLSSCDNHLPKCAKMHFSGPQVAKFPRGGPRIAKWGEATPLPYPPLTGAKGAWKGPSPRHTNFCAAYSNYFRSTSNFKANPVFICLRIMKRKKGRCKRKNAKKNLVVKVCFKLITC